MNISFRLLYDPYWEIKTPCVAKILQYYNMCVSKYVCGVALKVLKPTCLQRKVILWLYKTTALYKDWVFGRKMKVPLVTSALCSCTLATVLHCKGREWSHSVSCASVCVSCMSPKSPCSCKKGYSISHLSNKDTVWSPNHIEMHTRMCAHTHTHAQAHTHTHTHMHRHTHTRTHTHTHTQHSSIIYTMVEKCALVYGENWKCSLLVTKWHNHLWLSSLYIPDPAACTQPRSVPLTLVILLRCIVTMCFLFLQSIKTLLACKVV